MSDCEEKLQKSVSTFKNLLEAKNYNEAMEHLFKFNMGDECSIKSVGEIGEVGMRAATSGSSGSGSEDGVVAAKKEEAVVKKKKEEEVVVKKKKVVEKKEEDKEEVRSEDGGDRDGGDKVVEEEEDEEGGGGGEADSTSATPKKKGGFMKLVELIMSGGGKMKGGVRLNNNYIQRGGDAPFSTYDSILKNYVDKQKELFRDLNGKLTSKVIKGSGSEGGALMEFLNARVKLLEKGQISWVLITGDEEFDEVDEDEKVELILLSTIKNKRGKDIVTAKIIKKIDGDTKILKIPEVFASQTGTDILADVSLKAGYEVDFKDFREKSIKALEEFHANLKSGNSGESNDGGSGAGGDKDGDSGAGGSSNNENNGEDSGLIVPSQIFKEGQDTTGTNDSRTEEQQAEELRRAQGDDDVGHISAKEENIAIEALKIGDIELNFSDPGAQEKIKKITYHTYELAKKVMNSRLLVLIGYSQLTEADPVLKENVPPADKNTLKEILNNFFIKLTTKEVEALIGDGSNKKLTGIFTNKTCGCNYLEEITNTVIERDSKYNNKMKPSHDGKMIGVYALLWLMHFNYVEHDPVGTEGAGPLYDQCVSNFSIFDKGMDADSERSIINIQNGQILTDLAMKAQKQVEVLSGIHDAYTTGASTSSFQQILTNYHQVIHKNKAVYALAKRRDDWAEPAANPNAALSHHRFTLACNADNSQLPSNPLVLRYNDTTLKIPKGMPVVEQEAKYSHKYKFFGFDAIFDYEKDNQAVAKDILTNLIDSALEEKKPIPALCFIGYGQSGSGKTSTLVKLDLGEGKPGTQDGVLLELVKELKPREIKVSMIEIYKHEAAIDSDKSCMGIGTASHPKPGIIKKCYDKDPFHKERKQIAFKKVPSDHFEGQKPSSRFVPIGEILDKYFDDKSQVRQSKKPPESFAEAGYDGGGKKQSGGDNRAKHADDNIEVSFKINDGGGEPIWTYKHEDKNVEEGNLDYAFPLANYILSAFDSREIAPTSNNKQSSRSHVAVKLELLQCINKDDKDIKCAVFDLAGVENIFDCNQGSSDIIRMKAKIMTNKNYSNNLGDVIESWEKLQKKRVGHLVKYPDSKIHIGTTPDEPGRADPTDSYPQNPYCWPDGSKNSKGELDEVIEKMMLKSMHLLAAKKKMPKEISETISQILLTFPVNPDTIMGIGNKLTQALNKLQNAKININTDKGIKIIDLMRGQYSPEKQQKENDNFWTEKGGTLSSKTASELGKQGMTIPKWRSNFAKGIALGKLNGSGVIEGIRNAFSGLAAPDCIKAFNDGIENSCGIRTREGYIINNTLAQLNRDVKYISQNILKEKLGGDSLPCLFGDVYDEYSKYSFGTDPLMNWYDIQSKTEKNAQFGSIIQALCILESSPNELESIRTGGNFQQTKEKQLEILKKYKFCYTTVLNETFIMRRNGKEVLTPAGNPIYVNNRPTPPYVNIGLIKLAYQKYLFYKYYESDNLKKSQEKRKIATLDMYKKYFNLLIKLMTYPMYQDNVIDIFNEFSTLVPEEGQKNGGYSRFIFFKDKNMFFEYIKTMDKEKVKKIEYRIKSILKKIEKNNKATYIGTIQSTEEVNRISDKVIISEEIEKEAKYDALGRVQEGDVRGPNINNMILRALYNICYLQKGRESFQFKRALGDESQIRSAIKYECLYTFNEITAEMNSVKRAQSAKEKDIQDMTTALENVFPIATRFMDYRKIQYIWEHISAKERADYIIVKKTGNFTSRGMPGNMGKDYVYYGRGRSGGKRTTDIDPNRSKYPYRRDESRKVMFGGKPGFPEEASTTKEIAYHGHTEKILQGHIAGPKGYSDGRTGIPTQSEVTNKGALVSWNEKLQEIISLEPSTYFVSPSIFKIFEKSCTEQWICVRCFNPNNAGKRCGQRKSRRGEGDKDKKGRKPDAELKHFFPVGPGEHSKTSFSKNGHPDTTATGGRKGVTITTPTWDGAHIIESKPGKPKDVSEGFLTYGRFRDMCNIMRDAEGKYKRKMGLLYYLVRDDFYNEVYQRYILANHAYNDGDNASSMSTSQGNDQARSYPGAWILNTKKKDEIRRGYKELKPAIFKSEFFSLKKDRAYDKTRKAANDPLTVTMLKGGSRQSGKGTAQVWGKTNNPFKLRINRVWDIKITNESNTEYRPYGLPLEQSKEDELNKHAWALFKYPKTMNTERITRENVEKIVPLHTLPWASGKGGKGGTVFIPGGKGLAEHYKDLPSVWGWAPQDLGDTFYKSLKDGGKKDSEIVPSLLTRIKNLNLEGGYKKINRKKNTRKKRKKNIKKKKKEKRKRNTRKR